MTPIRVLHPITRLIIGGAQENTMLTAEFMNFRPKYAGLYSVDVVSGPQTGPEGSLIDETRRRNVPLTIMPELRREVSPANDLKALFKLRKMMTNGGYDVVHTHSSKAGVLGRMAAKMAGVPLIVHTVHGWSFHERMSNRKRGFYVALEKLAAAQGDAMVVVSPRDIEKGTAQGICQPSDYTVIRSGIELDRFGHPAIPRAEMRDQLGIPQEALVVGNVGRFSEQKSPLDMIEAFGRIKQQHPDTWFVLVGDGPLRSEVEAKLAALGLTEHTILTGVRRDVPELMKTFDIFALSSLWEGLPRVLPQAMASGLPIVCTKVDGSAEAVADGENGFLVEPANPAQLADRVCTLLEDAELRQRMAAVGLERVPTFGTAKMVEDIHNLYQQLLVKKGLAAAQQPA